MSEDVERLLRELLALSPAPTTGSDPSDLIVQAVEMTGARQPLLEQLAALLASGASAEGSESLREELADRDARWSAALVTARDTMGQRVARANSAARRAYRR